MIGRGNSSEIKQAKPNAPVKTIRESAKDERCPRKAKQRRQ